MPHSHRLAIADTVTRLLSHFGTTDEPLAVRQAIGQDWVDDLEEFTLPQVQWAASEWRRTYATRPTIAEIRKLAIQAQREDADRRALEDKNQAQAGAVWEPWLFDLWGPASTGIEARRQAIAANEARYQRAEQWRRDNPNWAQTKPALTARDLGVRATEAPRSPLASYPDDPA